jgi:hypothetical protein
MPGVVRLKGDDYALRVEGVRRSLCREGYRWRTQLGSHSMEFGESG